MKKFKEYCIKNGISKNTADSYSSWINTGLKALKNIIPNNKLSDIELLEFFFRK
jgi:hypothetical protein